MEPNNTNPTSWRSHPGPKRSDHRPSYFSANLPLIATCILLATVILISAVPTAAQTNIEKNESVIRDPKLPWQLEADRVDYDQTADEYTATGNVLIYKKNIRLSADFVRFDHKNMMAYAEGDVVLTDGDDVIRGASMDINLEAHIGSLGCQLQPAIFLGHR